MATFTIGAMSKSSLTSPRSSRNSPTFSGEKKVGIQPSAISPVSAVFLGPMAAM